MRDLRPVIRLVLAAHAPLRDYEEPVSDIQLSEYLAAALVAGVGVPCLTEFTHRC